MLIARIDMVNKKQYEESEIYKEIKIIIPRTSEELKKDFSDMLEKVDNIIEKIDTTIANTEEIYDE